MRRHIVSIGGKERGHNVTSRIIYIDFEWEHSVRACDANKK